MSKDIINYYLQSLTVDNAIYLASTYSIYFSREEAEIILPMLKQHWEWYLDEEKKQCFLKDISAQTSNETAKKVDMLLSTLINKLYRVI